MKPVIVAASVVAAFALAAPGASAEQKPRRSPEAAPTVQAPPDQSSSRPVAVPREAVAPREGAPKSSPRTETKRGEGVALTSSSENARESDDQQRRGAVRRPSSDGRGSGSSPRDRAVARTSPPPRDWDGDRSRYRDRIYYYPSYFSYGRYYDPYSFHLGYLSYAPWGWTPAFYGYPYAYGGPAYQGYELGRVRFKVDERDAEVFVDGYYAGLVDDFDGIFQSLKLEPGNYKIEIRKSGFATLYFDVHVQPDRTITYRGDMVPEP